MLARARSSVSEINHVSFSRAAVALAGAATCRRPSGIHQGIMQIAARKSSTDLGLVIKQQHVVRTTEHPVVRSIRRQDAFIREPTGVNENLHPPQPYRKMGLVAMTMTRATIRATVKPTPVRA